MVFGVEEFKATIRLPKTLTNERSSSIPRHQQPLVKFEKLIALDSERARRVMTTIS